ncbi:MAG: hypothetical protein IT294_07950 [Deltaproteobacteria bacterium]|nr:hypothetical protein [Deltaproteobacteria bacterium]
MRLERTDRLDQTLRNDATVTPEVALERAAGADGARGRGAARGPLYGVPLAIKDFCATRDAPIPVPRTSRAAAGSARSAPGGAGTRRPVVVLTGPPARHAPALRAERRSPGADRAAGTGSRSPRRRAPGGRRRRGRS